jgi:hypothetical protein
VSNTSLLVIKITFQNEDVDCLRLIKRLCTLRKNAHHVIVKCLNYITISQLDTIRKYPITSKRQRISVLKQLLLVLHLRTCKLKSGGGPT